MSNMSYCRFHNTLLELKDCEEHMGDLLESKDAEDDREGLSEEEDEARTKLIKLCKRIADGYGEEDD